MAPSQLPKLPPLTVPHRLATEGIVVGVDIGGTKQTVAAAQLDGTLVALRRRRLRAGGTAQDVVAGICEMIDAVLAESAQRRTGVAQASQAVGAGHAGPAGPAGHKVLRIGIGFGGPVDQKRGVVLTSHHVPGWDGFPLRSVMEGRYDVPAILDNDANAAALGELLFGAGRGQHNLLYVNVGTGIGAGVIVNGALYHGEHGMAGELGHVTVEPDGPVCACGKRGCLEAVASGRSFGRRAREAAARDPAAGAAIIAEAGGNPRAIEGPHVMAAAAKGDALARRLIAELAEYLGRALGNAANLLDPGMIVVGGGLSEAGDALFGPLAERVKAHLLPSLPAPRVVPAALGYDAGIAGAIALALDEL